MKIAVLRDGLPQCFEGEQYIVDLRRRMDEYQPGDLMCYCTPFNGLPLWLEIGIRRDGSIGFRGWSFRKGENNYLQTSEKPEEECGPCNVPFVATAEQTETVNGLFSGRIKFEGLKLAVGATVQKLCPIDVEAEEARIGKTIYLA